MEKTAEQIAKVLDLSFGTINVILCRAEFTKYKDGRYYHVNRDFVENLYIYLNNRRKSKRCLYEKYKKAELKLYSWRKKL